MKKILRFFAALLAAAALALPASAQKPVTVTLSGDPVCIDQTCLIETSTYVPLRAFCAEMGVTDIAWDSETGTATVTAPGLTLRAKVGEVWIEVNGRAFHAPDGVRLVDEVMMLPVRPLARAFGLDVAWDAESDTALLTESGSGWAAEAASVYNEADLYWLSRIISAESRGEPLAGQLAVGNVVLNRVASDEFPDTIYDVIFDRKYAIQFTPIANGTIYNEPDEMSIVAAKLALEGYSLSTSVLYFLNPDLATSFWIPQNRPFSFTIGTHDFYT